MCGVALAHRVVAVNAHLVTFLQAGWGNGTGRGVYHSEKMIHLSVVNCWGAPKCCLRGSKRAWR